MDPPDGGGGGGGGDEEWGGDDPEEDEGFGDKGGGGEAKKRINFGEVRKRPFLHCVHGINKSSFAKTRRTQGINAPESQRMAAQTSRLEAARSMCKKKIEHNIVFFLKKSKKKFRSVASAASLCATWPPGGKLCYPTRSKFAFSPIKVRENIEKLT